MPAYCVPCSGNISELLIACDSLRWGVFVGFPSGSRICHLHSSLSQVTVGGDEWSYIASQGPLNNTCQDFWQMVWETGVAIIAMVTAEEVCVFILRSSGVTCSLQSCLCVE